MARPSLSISDPKTVQRIRNMRFLCPEKTDAEIASVMMISIPTVRKYTDDLYTKRRHAVRYVNMRNGQTFRI